MHLYLMSTDNATPEQVTSLLPGLRSICGQFEFILAGPDPAMMPLAGVIAIDFVCRDFIKFVDELAPETTPAAACKQFNKLIGKEVLLALANGRLWASLISFLAGDKALPADASPESLSLAHIYIKGFPAQNAGELLWIKTEADILAG